MVYFIRAKILQTERIYDKIHMIKYNKFILFLHIVADNIIKSKYMYCNIKNRNRGTT